MPPYCEETDPTKQLQSHTEWTISNTDIKDLEKVYNAKLKERREFNKKRSHNIFEEFPEKKTKILVKENIKDY